MASSCTIFFILLLLHIFQGKGVRGATFTFVNKCSQTIWPAILGSPKLESTGFELPKGSSRAFQAPTGWSGRFWGRTGCTFDDSGHGSCATGDCGSGQMECNGAGATAATLAEFTLGSGSMDFYDVSLVDGYNLPLLADVIGGSGQCASTGCVEDLNHRCPAELRIEGGGACRSACDAFNTPEYCCKGDFGSPSTCRPSMYSQLFKNACPKSYSYAYDDATSTFTCTAADYVITFCPSHPSQKSYKSDDGTADAADRTGSGSDSGSGSGSVQEAILADGSWLADLATGASTRTHSFDSAAQTLALLIVFVHLAAVVVPLQL
ncbi:hypothetical protein Pfo_019011 [Paulownia fortunei]|nr:hypothetical protein Pfo_019011 [Paulownia fortunei]